MDELDDKDTKSANEHAIEELKQKIEEGGTVSVSVDPPEREDDDEPAPPGEPTLSRAEKRRNRYREAKEAADRNAREVEELREQLQRTRAETEALKAHVTASQQPQRDPLDAQIERVQDEGDELYAHYHARAKDMSPDEYQQFKRKARELEERKIRLFAEKTLRENRVDPQALAEQQFVSENADVFNHQKAQLWFRGEYLRRQAEGAQATRQLAESVLRDARVRFGMARAPDATPEQKHRYGGEPGVGRGETHRSERSIEMTPEYRKMATAAYPHLSEAEAYTRWAQTVGKKLLAHRRDAR